MRSSNDVIPHLITSALELSQVLSPSPAVEVAYTVRRAFKIKLIFRHNSLSLSALHSIPDLFTLPDSYLPDKGYSSGSSKNLFSPPKPLVTYQTAINFRHKMYWIEFY